MKIAEVASCIGTALETWGPQPHLGSSPCSAAVPGQFCASVSPSTNQQCQAPAGAPGTSPAAEPGAAEPPQPGEAVWRLPTPRGPALKAAVPGGRAADRENEN